MTINKSSSLVIFLHSLNVILFFLLFYAFKDKLSKHFIEVTLDLAIASFTNVNVNKYIEYSRKLHGVVAQLVERLICIQEAWGSTPHNSIFLTIYNLNKSYSYLFLREVLLMCFCYSELYIKQKISGLFIFDYFFFCIFFIDYLIKRSLDFQEISFIFKL